ncbi:MAG: efflux transporter outer membrane subunit [Pseudomonadota bacterium]|nr:efflux transporter outer membrane subunit [Pseudomonadota bacterium]
MPYIVQTIRKGSKAPAAQRRLWASGCAHAVLLASALALSACAVGPRFERPRPPTAAAYTSAQDTPRLAPGHGEPPQLLVAGRTIPAQWWGLFHSPALDHVLREALADSPTLSAARATLAQAQQTVLAERGAYFPQLDIGATAERQKGPAFALGLLGILPGSHGLPTFDLYSLGPTVSYSPDVFGLNRRGVEARRAGAELERDQLAAAYLAITGHAVEEALNLARLRLEINALTRIVSDDVRNLALVRRKFSVGRAPRTDVLAAETQLANDRALLPSLRQQEAMSEDALAILAGKAPGQWQPPAFRLADFHLPSALPLSLPSALVRQRPDILAAEQEVHVRSAQVGIATARMYPSIVLSASLATAALRPEALFGSSSGVWAALGGLTAPVFHGGTLRAERRAAMDALTASLALYRQTVLMAFGQVTDTLRALGNDAELAAAEREALDTARASLQLQRVSYEAGRSNVLQLLDAERAYQQARLGYARATAQRYADSAQLLVALGGGWWNSRGLCPRSCAARTEYPAHLEGEKRP